MVFWAPKAQLSWGTDSDQYSVILNGGWWVAGTDRCRQDKRDEIGAPVNQPVNVARGAARGLTFLIRNLKYIHISHE